MNTLGVIQAFIIAKNAEETLAMQKLILGVALHFEHGGEPKTHICLSAEDAKILLGEGKNYNVFVLSGEVPGIMEYGIIEKVKEDYPKALIVFCSDQKNLMFAAKEKGITMVHAMEPLITASKFSKSVSGEITKTDYPN